jgi:hypothetical protein
MRKFAVRHTWHPTGMTDIEFHLITGDTVLVARDADILTSFQPAAAISGSRQSFVAACNHWIWVDGNYSYLADNQGRTYDDYTRRARRKRDAYGSVYTHFGITPHVADAMTGKQNRTLLRILMSPRPRTLRTDVVDPVRYLVDMGIMPPESTAYLTDAQVLDILTRALLMADYYNHPGAPTSADLTNRWAYTG